MKFNIITIFPEIIEAYSGESILKRACEKDLLEINAINLRDFTHDKHKTTDDAPYGGGPGMVMKVEPFYEAIQSVKKDASKKHRIIAMSPQGRTFNQRVAEEYASTYDEITILCGRYEGYDARVFEFVDEKISIGDFVLCGGELPALAVAEATARLKPGVLGDDASSKSETFSESLDFIEYPQYTRPDVFEYGDAKEKKVLYVPDVLKSGDHKKIEAWRKSQSEKQSK